MTTADHIEETRDPNLAHHFETPRQQYESGKLGMWLFLSTEVLLFGGLFCAYAVYRANHPEIFIYAHRFLDKYLGGLNTIILICSSFTMACAVRAAQLGKKRQLVALLTATLVFAACFLGVKGIEYDQKWKHGLLWGTHYRPHVHAAAEHGAPTGAAAGPGAAEPAETEATSEGEEAEAAGAAGPGAAAVTPAAAPAAGQAAAPKGSADRSLLQPAAIEPQGLAPTVARPAGPPPVVPKNVQIFFGIYFVMTGLHALHVIAGMIAISWLLVGALKGRFGPRRFLPVDNVGLYWHVVDIVWIFLFPLLYLIT